MVNTNFVQKKEAPRRIRVASEVKRILSEFIICGTMKSDDTYGSMASMIAITDVEMSPDLQHAKVFVSSILPSISSEQCLNFLETNKYKLRNHIGALMRLKRIPDLHFFIDNSYEQGEKIEHILKKLDIKK
ncbi:MAG: 30S ribosome-binding factor RbfA [Alphaproteobacteria bacterium]|nr:30S ribosome-binding factor RbfA [Alphaproteobacteria bacterium]